MSNEVLMISCPWHLENIDHPGGAPDCATMADNIAAGRVIPQHHLVSWLALVMGDYGPLVNIMWMHHLVSWGDDETKGKAKERLVEMGELDA